MLSYLKREVVSELLKGEETHYQNHKPDYNQFTYPEDQIQSKSMKEFTEKFEKDYHPKYTGDDYKIKKKPGFNEPAPVADKKDMREYMRKSLNPDIFNL